MRTELLREAFGGTFEWSFGRVESNKNGNIE